MTWVTHRLALQAGYTADEIKKMLSMVVHAPNNTSWTVFCLPKPIQKEKVQ